MEEVLKKLEALQLKVRTGLATQEEKTELKALKKRKAQMYREFLKKLDGG
jgi:Caudovirales tail fibre assembly protein, lambda gpK